LALGLLAAGPRGLAAQRTARAAVSVAVVPPVMALDVLGRAVAIAVAQPGVVAGQTLPAGARLVATPARSAPRNPLARRPGAIPVRRLTLEYAAN
jgi:hypothetical protein